MVSKKTLLAGISGMCRRLNEYKNVIPVPDDYGSYPDEILELDYKEVLQAFRWMSLVYKEEWVAFINLRNSRPEKVWKNYVMVGDSKEDFPEVIELKKLCNKLRRKLRNGKRPILFRRKKLLRTIGVKDANKSNKSNKSKKSIQDGN